MKKAHCFTDVLAMIQETAIFRQAGELVSNQDRAEFETKSDALKQALLKQREVSGDNIDVETLTPSETELGPEADAIYKELMDILTKVKGGLDEAKV